MKGKKINKFYQQAILAVQSEMLKKYSEASLLWRNASLYAFKEDNYKWSIARADFCRRQADKH
ncbi:ANR family transcriptional regulator [Escherichia coli]|jgi:c-di-GMP-related signal transduction protein|uniref:ANR family transcriptional regulator n=1 Tax=Escherichia coli TaxID=562 RepID=UPI000BE4605E|nr:ANR family transcriptional regulator [Escherichia coli]EEC7775168.1 ANR family transcriptional regulator [Escherichia coli]EFG5095566.1 ANR family transcriptional regulator [Escherichia coli]EFH7000177.1 ANR family transcriptional regulator [Escherichia coli]EGM8115153.1 ANR family transcriptional regulator [Escherichia coli]EGM9513352.1 ANR family transcriptional regulator [Escherichia coli]